MRIIALLFLCFLNISLAEVLLEKEFNDFKTRFGKSYETTEEVSRVLIIFVINLQARSLIVAPLKIVNVDSLVLMS